MKQHDTSYTALYPLFLTGILLILLLVVIKQYMATADMQSTVILPGGQTYTGK